MSELPTPDNSVPKLFYTVNEVAEMCGVCADTVYRLLARGVLTASPHLRHKRITSASLKRFIKAEEGER